jgi:endo-1,4-beta-xylanase
VPFDGIGIQAHEPTTMRFPLDRVQRILDRYATLGKKLYITEYEPTSAGNPITGSYVTGKWDEAAQADWAAEFYTVCFAHPAMAGITWWDLSDAGSWLEGGGLLRKDLSEKPVYTALQKLIREQWMTRTQGKTDRTGRYKFRGFQGDYTVKVTVGGKSVEQIFTVHKGQDNMVECVVK